MAKKRKAKKRARPRTSRRAVSRAKRRTVSRTKDKAMERWFIVIVSVIIIGAIILSVPSVNLNGIMHQNDQEQQQTEITTNYPCKSNLDCLLVSCRDTPSDSKCVNAVASDTYGIDVCGGYSKVSVPYHDYTRCSCVQGLCKLIR